MRVPSFFGRWVLPAIGVGWLLSLGGATHAQAAVYTSGCADPTECTFQELLGGGTIVAGGQRFAGFQVEIDPGMIDWNAVVVSGLDDVGLTPGPGLRFTHNEEARIVDSDCLDLQFSYTVTPVITSWQPVGNELALGFQTVVGGGRIEVDEALFDQAYRAVGDKTIQADPKFDTTRVIDTIEFSPQTGLVVSNTIVLEGDAPGDTANLGDFTQRFALMPVPEPGLLSMVASGLGLLGFMGTNRTRNRRVPVQYRPRARHIEIHSGEPR